MHETVNKVFGPYLASYIECAQATLFIYIDAYMYVKLMQADVLQ